MKKILEKVRVARDECGYDSNRDIYQPLKLVRVVVGIVNNLIIDLQDNAKLYEVPLPPTSPNASELTKLKQAPKVSVDAIKNSRRTMEDRHAIIEDFNAFFNTQVCGTAQWSRISKSKKITFRIRNRHSTTASLMDIPARTQLHMPIRTSITTFPFIQATRPISKRQCKRLSSSPT